MRFIVADERAFSISDLDDALASALPDCRTEPNGGQARDVYLREECLWEIDVLERGDERLAEERAYLLESLPSSGEPAAVDRVRKSLEGATAMLIVRVLFAGRESSEAHEKLDALWAWLFAHRTGLIQSDDGPCYFDERPAPILQP